MNRLIKFLSLVLFALFAGVMTCYVLVIDDKPKLQKQAFMTPDHIAKARKIFRQNDPRRLQQGSIAVVALNQDDLDLAVNYFANQFLGAVAALKLESGNAVIEGTLPANTAIGKRYLNIKFVFKETQDLPEIDHFYLGNLRLPGSLAQFFIENYLVKRLPDAKWLEFYKLLRGVKFEPERMLVTYQWQHQLPRQLGKILLSEAEQHRLEIYQKRLAELTWASKSNLSLTELTQPLFQLASLRSSKNDAVAENRAAILVLTMYANRQLLQRVLPWFSGKYPLVWRMVNLNERDDLTKHYLISALLAAYAGTPLADAVGLYKELEDSKGGSGFSFNDLAADRAGVRLGELAISNEEDAKKLQALMSVANERDIMPVTADLPEFMAEPEFMKRYGGMEGDAYQEMMKEIERRINSLAINRMS